MLKKINFLNIILYLAFFIILGRIYYLQVIEKDYYTAKLLKFTEKEVLGDSMPRGRIYDTNNNLLVDNRLVPTIYFKNDYNLTTKELIELAYEVSNYIDLDYSKLSLSYLKDFYLLENDNTIKNRLTDLEIDNYKKRKISDLEYYKLKKEKITEEDLSIYKDIDKKAIYLYYLILF